MNETLQGLFAHRTIRSFVPEAEGGALEDAHLDQALRAAQMASTSSNIQAYSLLRVRNAKTRSELVQLTGGQPQVAQAGAFFVVSADQRRHALVAARAGSDYVPNLETFLLGVVDASLFAQNLVVAFESLSYGICYIGGLRNELARVDRLLELPAHVLPLFGLCVGRPADDPGQRPRLAPEAVLFEERYPTGDELLALIDEYDGRMGDYYRARGKPEYTWTGALARRFSRAHREHLAEYYGRKGAVLSRTDAST